MILGFGNNVVSSLASDITASQTTFSVIPGDGPLFAALLTSDFSNKSTTLKKYAKITLTDSGETAFEVCHLTAVSGDTLTVIRGQEGTAAKGWALKDVVANFATRGSENAFPQISHIQSGFYTSGTAGGTANALTLELPTSFFLNGSTDWVLKTPIVVYPTLNNTGAATLQLTMGGRVLGTFPLYKGNKAALVANDILKDVALVCLLDNTKTFFNVANPGAIYAGLGTAAFCDVTKDAYDTTSGRVLKVGDYGLGAYIGAKTLTSIFDITCGATYSALGAAATSGATAGMPANSSNTKFGVYAYSIYTNQFWVTLVSTTQIYTGMVNTNTKSVTWTQHYTDTNKPTASDVDAVSASKGGTFQQMVQFTKGLRLAGADYLAGISYGSDAASFSGANLLLKSWYGIGFYSNYPDSGALGIMGYINVRIGRLEMKEQIIPGNYGNFDARYQAKGSYYTTAQSDARYNLKNTVSKSTNGWQKDGTTGLIIQFGSGGYTNNGRITFPTAFPNACLSVVGNDTGTGIVNVSLGARNTTGFTMYSAQNSVSLNWIAIGY